MDAKTLGVIAGEDYDSDLVVLFTTSTSGNIQTWRAPKDGFILGWQCSAASQWALTVAVDPPAATPVVQGSVTAGIGAAFIGGGTNPASTHITVPPLRFRFKNGDAINLRTFAATAVCLWLYVGYPRS